MNEQLENRAGKIPLKRIVSFLISLFLLAGCGDTDTTFVDQNKAAWQACVDTGGVPIRSAWSSQMADCIYKGN